MNPLINSLMVRAADAPVIKPAVELGTPLLLTIAALGIALLLVMIIRFKIQAFVALLTVSILVAVASQIPLKDVFTVVANGVGGTMGKVALLIALGAILGRMIEVSGGVQSLASHFTEKLGAKRVAVALTAVGFLVAIPVFFEVGVIVLVPIVYAFSKIANVHPVKFGLPMAGIMLSIHVAVPPHPGIVAGAGVFGADIGLITLISLIICIPLGFLSYWVASIMNRKEYELLPSVKAQVEEFGSASLVHVGHDGPGAHAVAPPRPGLIIFLIAAPIVQILLGTVGTLTISKDNFWYGVAAFVGNPFLALLVAVGLSFFLLAVRRQWSLRGNRRDLRRRTASHRLDPDGCCRRRCVRRSPAHLRHRRGTLADPGPPWPAADRPRLHHFPGSPRGAGLGNGGHRHHRGPAHLGRG